MAKKEITQSVEGKLPPQATDLEEAVLGAIMISNGALNSVIDILAPDSFYKESHARIYNAILNLNKKGQPIDILTVIQELRRSGELELCGGHLFVSSLTNKVATASHIEAHARIIAEKHIAREIIKISSELVKEAYDETVDVFDLVGMAESMIIEIRDRYTLKPFQKVNNVVKEALDDITDRMSDRPTKMLTTPNDTLRKKIGGWHGSRLYVVGARPGMGKTSWILSEAYDLARNLHGVGIFSLEMSAVELTQTLISYASKIETKKVTDGKPTQEEFEGINRGVNVIEDLNIFIDDTAGLNIYTLRARAKKMVEMGVKIIFVDYIQLISARGDDKKKFNESREQEISTISRLLKMIAKELNIPIIALSQLSRDVEKRSDKRPQLSDLRESGAIEQDADFVAFLYREEYYKPNCEEKDKGIIEFNIAKYRRGTPNQNIRLKFLKEFGRVVANNDEMPF